MTHTESFKKKMTAWWLGSLESLWTSFRSWLQLYYHHPFQRWMNWKMSGVCRATKSVGQEIFGKISGRVPYSALPGRRGMPARASAMSLFSENSVRFRVTWTAQSPSKSVTEKSFASFAFNRFWDTWHLLKMILKSADSHLYGANYHFVKWTKWRFSHKCVTFV